MTALELKTSIHSLVDQIEDEDLLIALLDFLKSPAKRTKGSLWNKLTDDQKKEVLLSYEESNDDDNLISKEEFLKSI